MRTWRIRRRTIREWEKSFRKLFFYKAIVIHMRAREREQFHNRSRNNPKRWTCTTTNVPSEHDVIKRKFCQQPPKFLFLSSLSLIHSTLCDNIKALLSVMIFPHIFALSTAAAVAAETENGSSEVLKKKTKGKVQISSSSGYSESTSININFVVHHRWNDFSRSLQTFFFVCISESTGRQQSKLYEQHFLIKHSHKKKLCSSCLISTFFLFSLSSLDQNWFSFL